MRDFGGLAIEQHRGFAGLDYCQNAFSAAIRIV